MIKRSPNKRLNMPHLADKSPVRNSSTRKTVQRTYSRSPVKDGYGTTNLGSYQDPSQREYQVRDGNQERLREKYSPLGRHPRNPNDNRTEYQGYQDKGRTREFDPELNNMRGKLHDYQNMKSPHKVDTTYQEQAAAILDGRGPPDMIIPPTHIVPDNRFMEETNYTARF